MSNRDQKEFWARSAGPTWVAQQVEMDALLGPVLDRLLHDAALTPGQRVLDVGCGTGESVARIAQAVGPQGHVTGVDISDTMLGEARDRLGGLPQVALSLADAQTHVFERSYDVILSRFGVMFFEDTRAAFANLWSALEPGGRMVLAAWGPAPDNPYFMEPAAAARDVLGPMPKVDRTLPGPFAFEDAARISAMLGSAGVENLRVETVALALTPMGGLEALAELCCHIGPADKAIQFHAASEDDKVILKHAIIERFARYDGAHGLRIPARIHLYAAHKAA